MNKRGIGAIWISILLLLSLLFGMFFYFALGGTNYDLAYEEMFREGKLNNPLTGKSIDSDEINEDFVYYFLLTIRAYNLHSPPLQKDLPKIEVHIGESIFNGVIENGKIKVSKGEIEGKDIIIKTSKEELFKIIDNVEYVRKSFGSERSEIRRVASKSVLLSKGYLKLYDFVNKGAITGNIIRMYSS